MNKYQEALDRLAGNIAVARSEYRSSGVAKEDLHLLQELVDRSKPKEPVKFMFHDHKGYRCPSCHSTISKITEVGFETPDYCKWCGQKLDFGGIING